MKTIRPPSVDEILQDLNHWSLITVFFCQQPFVFCTMYRHSFILCKSIVEGVLPFSEHFDKILPVSYVHDLTSQIAGYYTMHIASYVLLLNYC